MSIDKNGHQVNVTKGKQGFQERARGESSLGLTNGKRLPVDTITTAALADEFDMEDYAVAAALDVTQGDEVDANEAREILAIMAEQYAELTD